MQDFHRVIGRAVLDENFRAQLFNNPQAALQGFNLSPQEVQTLTNMTPDQFNALAQQFEQQLPGVDVLKHKMSADLFPKAGGGEHFLKMDGSEHYLKLDGSQPASQDYFEKWNPAENPSPDMIKGELNFAKQADFIKGEANFQKVMPGASPRSFTGGVRPRSFTGGVVIAIIAILIGLLLFFVFAPIGMINGGMQAMSLNFTCPSDPSRGELLPAVQMGDGSVMPAGGGVFVPAGDVNGAPLNEVNGDGLNAVNGDSAPSPEGPGSGEWIELESFSWGELASFSWGELHFDDGLLNFADGMLNFTNILRIQMGGQPFLPLCAPPPMPGGDEVVNEGDGGGTTGGGQPTGGASTGGQSDGGASSDGGLCANNGGIQWQGTACVCPGLVDNVTMCADGTKLDQVTDQACTPDQACDQATDPQNPPPACACTYVCMQTSLAAVGQCSQGAWLDCTGAPCQP